MTRIDYPKNTDSVTFILDIPDMKRSVHIEGCKFGEILTTTNAFSSKLLVLVL